MILGYGLIALVFAIIFVVLIIMAVKKKSEILYLFSVCPAFIIIVFVILGSTMFIVAKAETREFEYTREIVEEAYAEGSCLDNIAISNSVINANSWLAEAKASKQTFGIFSAYYCIDLDNIEPIKIKT